jgi:Na+-driven multidrug efflux pump
MQPIAFGFGTAVVAMVGTNYGARQYDRARRIAWTGALTIAVVCGTLGLIVAVEPGLWLGLFSSDAEVARIGALYLRIVGPVYVCFGLGWGLFFVSQGYGRGTAPMAANAVRLAVNAGAAVAVITWLGLGIPGLFAAVSGGFVIYAILLVWTVLRVEPPA